MAVMVERRTRNVAKVGSGFVGLLLLAALWVAWRLTTQSMPDIVIPPGPVMPAVNGANTIAAAAKMYKANAVVPGYSGSVTFGNVPLWAVKKAVAANQPTFALLRQGLALPCQYPVVRHLNDPCSLFLDEVALAEFIPCEGRVYESQGEWRKAADSYLNCIELASRYERNSGLLPQLVGVLMVAIGTDPLAGFLDRCDAKTAAYIRDRLLKLYPQCGDPVAMMREVKNESLAHLQEWGHTGKTLGQKDDWGNRYLLSYFSLSKKTVIRNCIEWHDEMIRWAAAPAWRRGTLKMKRTDPVNAAAMPLYTSAISDTEKKLCKLRLVLIRAALIAWRSSHGRAPESLASLGLPASMTRDTFRDAELVYHPESMQVYSVGLNQTDDGGKLDLDILPLPDPPPSPPVPAAKSNSVKKPVTPDYRSARAGGVR